MLRILFAELNRTVSGPAIFIDRDGVINRKRVGDYVLDWSQFVFMPGMRMALSQLASLGLPLIVISNQAAVGKRLLDLEGLREITVQMHEALVAGGTFLAAAYYCTHRVDENCICRKPKPGLLYRAADDFNIEVSRSIFIGDSETDVQAAQAVGCIPVLFGSDLCGPSDLSGWITGLPCARTARELREVVVKCLHAIETPAANDHAGRRSGS